MISPRPPLAGQLPEGVGWSEALFCDLGPRRAKPIQHHNARKILPKNELKGSTSRNVLWSERYEGLRSPSTRDQVMTLPPHGRGGQGACVPSFDDIALTRHICIYSQAFRARHKTHKQPTARCLRIGLCSTRGGRS